MLKAVISPCEIFQKMSSKPATLKGEQTLKKMNAK